MSKRRSTAGPESDGPKRASGPARPAPETDEQRELGNAALQGRLETDEVSALDSDPPKAAIALLDHAIAALHSDGADTDRLAARVALIERSALPDRDALVDRLHARETVRTVVDAALDRWFGGHDVETRWAVDAQLLGARAAIAGEGVALPDGAGQRGDVAGAAAASALEVLQAATTPAVVGLCQTLALAVLLDEDEDEEEALFDLAELS